MKAQKIENDDHGIGHFGLPVVYQASFHEDFIFIFIFVFIFIFILPIGCQTNLIADHGHFWGSTFGFSRSAWSM